jgi:Protein of unknown function (DUF1116)
VPLSAAIDYAEPFRGALWFDVLPRAAACPDLSAYVLLHAGPPYRGAPPAPVINGAVQALLFEGLAADIHTAHALLQAGRVQLRPAQDYEIVTPLAQVVSSSMLLLAVEQLGEVLFAPMVEGPPPALRFGSDAAQCRERLRTLNDLTERAITPLIRRAPIAIDELIGHAIAAGEDCHVRTSAANEALIERLPGLDAEALARLRSNPAFVLPILMAAAAASMRTHESRVAAIGGNGIDFGIRLRGQNSWQQRAAEAPRGPRLAGLDLQTPLGAIGDSAVIDFCGLGGQALAAAPALAAEWSAVLPPDALSRRERLIDPQSGIVDPERVVRHGVAPLINLAVLDRDGIEGLIARGCYCPPVSLFAT